VQLRPTRAGDDKKRFLKLLQQLVGERWIAAPLVSLEKKRLQRFIEKKPVSSDLIEYSVTLPMEGSPLSAEGLAMLLAQDNKHASESTLTTDCPGFLASLQPNATKWSEILLGQSPLSSSHPSRGLWMQWNRKLERTMDQDEDDSNNHLLQWKYGLFYSRIIPHISSNQQGSAEIAIQDILPIDELSTSISNRFCTVPAKLTIADTSMLTNTNEYNTAAAAVQSIPFVCGARGAGCNLSSALTLPLPPTILPQYWHVTMTVARDRGRWNTGRLISTVNNDHPTCSVTVSLDQVIPKQWVQPIWGTMQVEIVTKNDDDTTCIDNQTNTIHIPWNDQQQSSIKLLDDNQSIQVHLEHVLLSQSRLQWSVQFDPMFLPFESFPGDPNRGLEWPPLTVVVRPMNCPQISSNTIALVSNSLLFMAPLPDMSMPFNVLSLTCTLYAFIIGSLMNHIVRRSSEKVKHTLDPYSIPKSKWQLLKEKWNKRRQSSTKDDSEQPPQDDGKSDEVGRSGVGHANRTLGASEDVPTVTEDSPAKAFLDELLWKSPGHS
jgi:phosphatidylinositol glycan class T